MSRTAAVISDTSGRGADIIMSTMAAKMADISGLGSLPILSMIMSITSSMLGPGFISIPASTSRMRREATTRAPEARILQVRGEGEKEDEEEEEEGLVGQEEEFALNSIEIMARAAWSRIVVSLTLHTREEKVEEESVVVVALVESLVMW